MPPPPPKRIRAGELFSERGSPMGADTMTHKGSPSGGGAMVMMALWGLLAILAITMLLSVRTAKPEAK